jgi:uncharacterized protein YbbC (DUF1343 family)
LKSFYCLRRFFTAILITFLHLGLISQNAQFMNFLENNRIKSEQEVIVGAERTELYLPYLKTKRVALLVNHSSRVFGQHLVDYLIKSEVDIKRIFAPEHGFRGEADAGELVPSTMDSLTGIQIRSLYGKNKKPTPADLREIDVLVFDIQDVGARFYTYISTMHYAMEACAENGVEFLVLDRPNPNGFYTDGPVLQKGMESFVGMHPVPVVHGMTVGEYAKMINGEGWLAEKITCKLSVIEVVGWDHSDFYQLPVRPSPNLPNMLSVYLYPSLALFEGTNVSVGRGTDFPFQVFGSPFLNAGLFEFVPTPKPGAMSPKHNGMTCRGIDLRQDGAWSVIQEKRFNLEWMMLAYNNTYDKEDFFLKNGFFDLLSGNKKLHQQVVNGTGLERIRKSWTKDLEEFKNIRSKYLLYPDFEQSGL